MRLIHPEPGPEIEPIDLIEGAGLRELGATEHFEELGRPFVYSNFAATVNGLAAIEGRSGAIGSETDTQMLMALRRAADAVLVGAGTVRAEQYGMLMPGEEMRRRRRSEGLSEQPLAVVLSGSMDLPWEAGLFSSGEGEVLIATSSGEEPPETATPVQVARFDGEIDLAELMGRLRAEHGVLAMLCEGGPSLHTELVEEELIDDFFLTVSPKLGGGGGPRITSDLPAEVFDLELVWLAEEEGELFSRYRRASA